jgi:hypothetical protein
MSKRTKPRKTAQEKVPVMRGFRLTEADAAAWDKKVRDANMTGSEFFRLAVIQNQTVVQGKPPTEKKRAVRLKDTVPADVKKAVFLLAQLGNNMNQIAHRLNLDAKAGKVTPAVYAAILKELTDISASVKGWA